ncbi:MAG: hypothetical protein OHK0022_24090 [Roseiflexaceae bacterium]
MSDDQEYLRHTIALIFDAPAERARKHPERLAEVLNILTSKIIDMIDRDSEIQDILRRNGIDWGLGEGTWEG